MNHCIEINFLFVLLLLTTSATLPFTSASGRPDPTIKPETDPKSTATAAYFSDAPLGFEGGWYGGGGYMGGGGYGAPEGGAGAPPEGGGYMGGGYGSGGGYGGGGYGGGRGGYGWGYGGSGAPPAGRGRSGIVRPSVVCRERGACYMKKLKCPASCFRSYHHSGKGYSYGGGGGGCTLDCTNCLAYC